MTKLQDFLNQPLSQILGVRGGVKAGDLFGIELECEGRRVDWDGDDNILVDWRPEHDGSLRDRHGAACEWVFNGPVKYKTAEKRINTLFDYFEKRKAELVCSNRTSCHVHYNMGDKNVYQVANIFILFTILEDILDNYCGEDRNGNLFCLSSRHAEAQLQWMMDALFRQHSFAGLRADFRYCSLNLAAINKFGTVEFRGMRGLDKREDLLAWLSILNEFCDYACYKMHNPVDLLQMISEKTPAGFLKEIFSPENYHKLTLGLDDRYISQSIYDGLRLVQMLVYKIGTEFDQVRLRGRDFWASFKDDGEAQPDVDPAVIRELANRRRPRANVGHGDAPMPEAWVQAPVRPRQPNPQEGLAEDPLQEMEIDAALHRMRRMVAQQDAAVAANVARREQLHNPFIKRNVVRNRGEEDA